MFGNYVPKGKNYFGGKRGDTGSVFSKHNLKGVPASKNTQCQKCEQYGHFTYQCNSTAQYKPRPSRTQQLLNPKVAKTTPSVELPDEFRNKTGVADEILKGKEKEREAQESKKRKRADLSSSSSDSDSSDSDSDSDSDDSSGSSSDSDSDSDSSGSHSSSSASRSRRATRNPRKRRRSSSSASRRSRSPS
ncbi:hypothetical protein BT69DRAFT_1279572 [Atractiella rhizophila]|nr:hypothetical protein BT69DRAFT_1279572 [Atractiella rhizophila]